MCQAPIGILLAVLLHIALRMMALPNVEGGLVMVPTRFIAYFYSPPPPPAFTFKWLVISFTHLCAHHDCISCLLMSHFFSAGLTGLFQYAEASVGPEVSLRFLNMSSHGESSILSHGPHGLLNYSSFVKISKTIQTSSFLRIYLNKYSGSWWIDNSSDFTLSSS